MAGLFGAEAPAYVGQTQNPAGDRGAVFGIFPSTPRYEAAAPVPAAPPAPSSSPVVEPMLLKVTIPGVFAADVVLTIPPSILAKLPELVPHVLAALAAFRGTPAANETDEREEPEDREEPAEPDEREASPRSAIQERVWDRE